MITKLVPVKDAETNELMGYREVASAQPASNVAAMVVHTYPITTPLVYTFEEYNNLPDLSVLENNNVVRDDDRSVYWLVK